MKDKIFLFSNTILIFILSQSFIIASIAHSKGNDSSADSDSTHEALIIDIGLGDSGYLLKSDMFNFLPARSYHLMLTFRDRYPGGLRTSMTFDLHHSSTSIQMSGHYAENNQNGERALNEMYRSYENPTMERQYSDDLWFLNLYPFNINSESKSTYSALSLLWSIGTEPKAPFGAWFIDFGFGFGISRYNIEEFIVTPRFIDFTRLSQEDQQTCKGFLLGDEEQLENARQQEKMLTNFENEFTMALQLRLGVILWNKISISLHFRLQPGLGYREDDPGYTYHDPTSGSVVSKPPGEKGNNASFSVLSIGYTIPLR